MNFIGLVGKFPLNRPLTEQEIHDHLLPSKPTRSLPRHQLSVIRMNSTCLEFCDKFFAFKGFITTYTGLFSLMLSGGLGAILLMVIQRWGTSSDYEQGQDIKLILGLSAMFIPVILFFLYQLRKESFHLTHYPMRFNRKTRMVHVFRLDGTVMSEAWDKLYFTIWKPPGPSLDSCEIHAHRLAEDGKTVLETFGLPGEAGYDGDSEDPHIWTVWEFVRIYMEEGPEKLYDLIDYAPDITEKRETWLRGFQRLVVGNFGSAPALMLVMAPIGLFISVGRWFAMHTSKIPVWPEEIAAQCGFETDDPYLRDAQHLAARKDY